MQLNAAVLICWMHYLGCIIVVLGVYTIVFAIVTLIQINMSCMHVYVNTLSKE